MSSKTKDYYEVLGVGRTASPDEIKAVYRKLARTHHPDLNPGDTAAEERFKELQEAYAVLSDPENRRKYDQYGEHWRYADHVPPPGARAPGGAPEGFDFGDFEFGFGGGAGRDIFEEFFGRGRAGARRTRRGRDVETELEVSLEEAHRGAGRTITLQAVEPCATCQGAGTVEGDKVCPTCGGAGQVVRPKTLDVNIPAGVRDGSTVRLAGQGGAGSAGGEPGDLYLHIRIAPHPTFRIVGDDDLEVELPVAPWEAGLGARIAAPTLDGEVELKVPAGSQGGRRLRLRGQGLNRRRGGRGDEYVRLKIVVPREVGDEERRLYEELARVSRVDPRAGSRRAKGGA
jgi:DnaJ-class molecular chaperone